MKHYVISVFFSLLFFLSVSPVHGQREVFKGEFYLGAGVGGIFSKVDFVPGISLNNKQGFNGGISAKYVSENHLGVIAELNYAQRGWEEKFDTSTGFSYSRTLNYIELPFMTHVFFGDKVRFIFNAGPQISLLMGDSEKMSQALSDNLAARKAADPDARIGMQYKGEYDLKPIEYGLIGGLGMEFRTGIGYFDLEGRYYFGLGDIFTSRRSENAYFSRSAFRVIEVKLTYYIRVK